MLFFSVGLPSRFGEWCDAVTARLVENALGPVEVFYADTLEQFALGVVKTGSPYMVVGSRQIVGQLWAALAQGKKGFVLALDDPRLALENLVVHHRMEFLLATRIVAKCCASVMSCAPIPGALALRASEASADPHTTARMIASHLKLRVSDADLANIIATLTDVRIASGRVESDRWWNGLEEWQRNVVRGAVDPYVEHLADGDPVPVTWERELFFINEELRHGEQHQLALRPVDITGRPRAVVYGPHITLPAGSWSATVALGFSADAAELSYIADVYADTLLAQVRIQPGGQRFVEANLDFAIAEPHMIAIRVSNERAAFDGRLALGHVIMTPHLNMRPNTNEYFSTSLSV